MKKAILLILLLSLIVSVLVLFSSSLRGIRIDEEHFPDIVLKKGAWDFDLNRNGYLSKKDLEDAKILIIWDRCNVYRVLSI